MNRLREQNSNWRGGTTMHNSGYRCIYAPNHPNASKTGYVLEHRYVISQALARSLRHGEIVHHKNHDRLGNRVENLELVESNSSHIRNHHHVNLKRRRRVQLVCSHCDISFERCPSNIKFERQFCSKSCHDSSRRGISVKKRNAKTVAPSQG